ncbi:hypothetical protein BDN72DRAFT_289578 [Pluteus cervinus]|uniref:Uncharacterized protein n=1 Tax=Pluteus cervinus TaxID=181527 RepID=A0ACD3AEG4_9AGAR|nr:hypothetical protein BDN72DRAFT_289578 [Pluteus cervinus]
MKSLTLIALIALVPAISAVAVNNGFDKRAEPSVSSAPLSAYTLATSVTINSAPSVVATPLVESIEIGGPTTVYSTLPHITTTIYSTHPLASEPISSYPILQPTTSYSTFPISIPTGTAGEPHPDAIALKFAPFPVSKVPFSGVITTIHSTSLYTGDAATISSTPPLALEPITSSSSILRPHATEPTTTSYSSLLSLLATEPITSYSVFATAVPTGTPAGEPPQPNAIALKFGGQWSTYGLTEIQVHSSSAPFPVSNVPSSGVITTIHSSSLYTGDATTIHSTHPLAVEPVISSSSINTRAIEPSTIYTIPPPFPSSEPITSYSTFLPHITKTITGSSYSAFPTAIPFGTGSEPRPDEIALKFGDEWLTYELTEAPPTSSSGI